MSFANDMLDRFRRDGDEEAFAALMEACRSSVTATCRQHLLDPDDVDDAVQETFVKLARRAGSIHGDVTAWLRAAAVTTAIDFARRAGRRHNLVRAASGELRERLGRLSWESIQDRLEEGLAGLDADSRSLVIARYLEGIPVHSLARQRRVTSAAISNRVARATAKVRKALRDVGFDRVDDAAVAAGLLKPQPGQSLLAPYSARALPPGLLWQQAEPGRGCAGGNGRGNGDGRSRRKDWRVLRVGVMISGMSCMIPSFEGRMLEVESQLWSIGWLKGDEVRLFSLVEPGTHESASVERGACEHGLTAGMIDASDSQALRLLDVIYIGQNIAMPPRVLDAITEAVSSGVGLYNEGWVATSVPGINHPKVRRLYLADQVGRYHTPGCHGLPTGATVLRRHPVIKSLRPGDTFAVTGCGPVFVPRPRAGTVLVVKDQPVVSISRNEPPMGPMKMPAITVGHLGKGRVVIASFAPSKFVKHPGLLWNFTADAVAWLAEPARAARQKRWESEYHLAASGPE